MFYYNVSFIWFKFLQRKCLFTHCVKIPLKNFFIVVVPQWVKCSNKIAWWVIRNSNYSNCFFVFFLMNNLKDWKVLLILWLSVQLRGPPIEKPPWTRWYQCSRPCWSLCTWPDRQWRRRWSLSGCVNTGASRSVWTPPKRWNLNGNKEGDVSDLWSTSHDIRIIIMIIIIIMVMGV